MELAVIVNGVERRVPTGCTVAKLIELCGLDATRVAVERNRDVVPRKTFSDALLAEGDRLELVTFVGGGA